MNDPQIESEIQQVQKSPAKKLSDFELAVVSYIDQHYWSEGVIPSDVAIGEALSASKDRVEALWKRDHFRQALTARGLDIIHDVPVKGEGLLTAEQVVLANMLLNLADKRTVREKCKEVGISPQKYYTWLRKPAFSNYLRRRAEQLFKDSDFAAYTSLLKAVEAGDLSATKFFFEMRGVYNPKMDINVNINVLLVQVVEVIQKWVKDPELLHGIAGDLEELQKGGRG